MCPDENGSNLLLLFVPQMLLISCLCFCLYSCNLMLCNSDVLTFCSKSVAWLLFFFYFFSAFNGLENVVLRPLGSDWHSENSRISNSCQCLSLLWLLYQFCLLKNSLFPVSWQDIIQGMKSKFVVVCHEMLTKECGHSLVRELQHIYIYLFSIDSSIMTEGFSRLI